MKKTLLLTAAIACTLNTFSQRALPKGVVEHKVDRAAELAAREQAALNETRPANMMLGSGQLPAQAARPASPPSSYNWSLLCGSMNCYGMIGSNQRALQYIPALDAISFIHRKSDFYAETPSLPSTAKSGVIVAEISTNWGTTWDSTCIYSNGTDWGRYPQGSIYNPSGNTSIANAYVVGSGPTVGASSFSGSWYASKSLTSYNTTASTAPGAQQFFQFTAPPYPAGMNRHGWPRNGFSVTNDGVAHALGYLANDPAGNSTTRGYAVITGTFNGATFDWKMDSIIPDAVMKSDGFSKQLTEGQMVWNQAGTIGYVVGIGALNGSTKANRSYQPIIYKKDLTASPNATWTLVNQLDFNTTFTTIPYHLPGHAVRFPVVTGDTTAIPFTNDFDITIDGNNNLHIGIVFMSGFSDHPDSLQYYSTYTSIINAGESYRWQHLPGERPYIYDFIGNGITPWKMQVIDSISSESPGSVTGRGGYNENPWDPSGTGGAKMEIESRLNMGHTPDGQYVSFSWAESDSLFTNGALKFNTLPDVKVRLMALNSGTNTYVMDMGTDLNVTASDNNVRSRATFHYMSPVTGAATIYTSVTSSYTVDVRIPFTVTNSNPYSQLTNNATWFGNNLCSFKFSQPSTVGIDELGGQLSTSVLYPNPAKNNAVFAFNLEQSAEVDVVMMNTVGQVVRKYQAHAGVGSNSMNLDLVGLSSGIYMVNVKAGSSNTTKKLIIE